MTKEELRKIIEDGQVLEDLFDLSDGQECLIYKNDKFFVSDAIIYIPDVWLNELAVMRSDDDVMSYAQRVVEHCYTGKDFVDECGGNVELAERLFHYCDWQSPSSALPEVDDREETEMVSITPDQKIEGQGDVPFDLVVMRQLLLERVQDNYANYRAELFMKERQELIDGADRIAQTNEVFQYFSECRLTMAEMEYFLKFQNPLEVATDHWDIGESNFDALDIVLANAVDKADDLTLYPLVTDAPVEKPSNLHKFMNVDLEAVLPKILAQKTIINQIDLEMALDSMHQDAASNDPIKRNFIVIFHRNGVACLNERDMFIAGTRSYEACLFHHYQSKEPVLAYSVELLGNGTNGLRGNLYQQSQYEMAMLAERAASPYTDVTITFVSGKKVRIPKKEYSHERISSLHDHYGDFLETRNEAADESVVQRALKREHERRDRMPAGHIDAHLQELKESRIQTEADRLVSELQGLTEPNTPDKTHFMAEVSPYFLPLASDDDMTQLFEKVQTQLKQPMYISQLKGRRGLYFFARHTQEREHKPSIKVRLEKKSVKTGKPAAKRRQTDKEVR